MDHPRKTKLISSKVHTSAYSYQRNLQKRNRQDASSIIKPVKEATPWINSFVLHGGKDKLGNPKLCICLDLMSLNKTVVCEPYHFKILEDVTHLIANFCIMIICDCKKAYWHEELDEVSSFLTTFNTKLGRFWYTVMPFSITVAGDVFQ